MSTTSEPARQARTRWLAGGVAAGLLGAMLASASLAPVAAQDPSAEPDHTLSVSGTGSVSVKPDVADVTVLNTSSGPGRFDDIANGGLRLPSIDRRLPTSLREYRRIS